MSVELNYFNLPLFFVLLREALEVSIVLSVLLEFVRRMSPSYNRESILLFKKLVWIGTLSGAVLTIIMGVIVITLWYRFGANTSSQEVLYEGIFGITSCIFITVTAVAFLKGRGLYEKLNKKMRIAFERDTDILVVQNENVDLVIGAVANSNPSADEANDDLSTITPDIAIKSEKLIISSPGVEDTEPPSSVEDRSPSPNLITPSKKFTSLFFWIPFLSILREGLETVLIVGGLAMTQPLETLPLGLLTGLATGCAVGYVLHRAGGALEMKWFFIIGSFVLFVMAAGQLSRSIGLFEDVIWAHTIGIQPDDDSAIPPFDPRVNIWYIPATCLTDPWWAIANSLVGWRCIASYWTVVGYIGYWTLLVIGLAAIRFKNLIFAKENHYV